ncbi:MAG: enoyl-CoA hydratase/isomerase family protein [Desulfobacterales bacterium]|nr:enoyl-CoA hydratase/isomerase family protein [Desulfobacterales bacterium]
MPQLNFVKMKISEGIADIIFNRPKHNVFNTDMIKEINVLLENLAEDNTLKCVVFRGEGPSWCAGVDVADHEPELVDQMINNFNHMFELIDGFDIPLIAAVHGACLGGGMEAAIACDIIIAARKAVFGQPEIKLGFFPPYAAIRLPQMVGVAKAIEICTTGKRYSADEARSMGLVSKTVEDEQFNDEVDKMIHEIQVNSPLIIRLNKRAVKQHLGMDFSKALPSAGDMFLNTLMKTEDTLEGIKSFYEKRKPEWKNR